MSDINSLSQGLETEYKKINKILDSIELFESNIYNLNKNIKNLTKN